MATHFDPYPDDNEADQAPCGTWLGEASNGTSNSVQPIAGRSG